MNFVIDVLLGPVTLPTKGLLYVFDKVQEQAEQEFNDPTQVRNALINLQQRVDSGELSLERYEAAEAVLLSRLDAIEERRIAAEQPAQVRSSSGAPTRRRRRRR
ncbi:MAG: gas vesicle protein GvpG [Actinomycetes bacterium]